MPVLRSVIVNVRVARDKVSLMRGGGILLALLTLALAPGLAGCGSSGDGLSQDEVQQREKAAVKSALQEQRLRKLEQQVKTFKKGGSGKDEAPPSSDSTPPPVTSEPPSSPSVAPCSDTVSVGPATSCAFAYNVEDAYYSSPGNVVDVYSPTTGVTYTMSCSGSAPTICSGGNNATVYLP